jgi:hypothetical protein
MASLHRINILVSSDIDLDGMSPMMLMGVGWAQAAAAWIDTGFQAATASSCIDDPARSLRGNLQMMNPCVQAAGGAAEEGDQVVRSLLLSVKLMVTTMPLAYQVSCHETRILLIRSPALASWVVQRANIAELYPRLEEFAPHKDIKWMLEFYDFDAHHNAHVNDGPVVSEGGTGLRNSRRCDVLTACFHAGDGHWALLLWVHRPSSCRLRRCLVGADVDREANKHCREQPRFRG